MVSRRARSCKSNKTLNFMEQLFLYFQLLRISSWIKNLLIFAPIFFAGVVWHIPTLFNVVLVSLAFCFVSSTVYVLNDLVDYKQDQKHPVKKLRPIAAGLISPRGGG